MTSFADLGVPASIQRSLKARRINVPFPIQVAAIPPALEGRDICGKAPTGSGKTIAFAIPMASRCSAATPHRPTGLVLLPTRELDEQVAQELRLVADAIGLTVASVYGGVAMDPQIKELKRGVDILVACPGRLRDLIDRRQVSLVDIEVVVVDEADRMADMGFLPEVKLILNETPAERQTMLFSATLDGDVATLVKRYQRSPVTVEVERSEADLATDIDHHFWLVQRNERIDHTVKIVNRLESVILFCRTRHGADRVAQQLAHRGVSTVALHGDKSQKQRDRAIELFRSGHAQVLVATDVAARGIHVDGVSGVIQFDVAGDDKDYTHRSGRTARAGQSGVVITLVLPETKKAAQKLITQLGFSNVICPVELGAIGSTRRWAPNAAPIVEPRTPRMPKRKSSRPGDSESRSRSGGRGSGSGRGVGGARPGKGGGGPARAGGPARSAGGPKRSAGGPTRSGGPKRSGGAGPAPKSARPAGKSGGPRRAR